MIQGRDEHIMLQVPQGMLQHALFPEGKGGPDSSAAELFEYNNPLKYHVSRRTVAFSPDFSVL
jgi:hypothetical protein